MCDMKQITAQGSSLQAGQSLLVTVSENRKTTAFLSLNSAAVPPHEQARAPFQVGSTLLLGKPLLGKVFGHWGNVPPFNISLSGAWVKEPNAYPEEAYHLFSFLSFLIFLFLYMCVS